MRALYNNAATIALFVLFAYGAISVVAAVMRAVGIHTPPPSLSWHLVTCIIRVAINKVVKAIRDMSGCTLILPDFVAMAIAGLLSFIICY